MTLLDPKFAKPNARAGSRILLVVVLIISLSFAALTRQLTVDFKEKAVRPGLGIAPGLANTNSLSSMPSYATILLLGGLRGPLVMFLWPTSEMSKQQHRLEDVDTEIEWIRLLQPEFDTVHLFEIWNKAYNLSVQMSSLHDKYTTILDGIDYGMKVDHERPDDINILETLAQVWGDKLSNSQEHLYYRPRVRRESQTLIHFSFPDTGDDLSRFRKLAIAAGWDEDIAPVGNNVRTHSYSVFLEPIVARRLKSTFAGPEITAQPEANFSQAESLDWRSERLEPVLDVDGNILPKFLDVRFPRTASDTGGDWYDGSALQFLKPYEPFPYGIPPAAFAFNLYKRSQMLLRQWNERTIQSGDGIVDSRPGIALKQWATDEWERGRRSEIKMWGLNLDDGQPMLPSSSREDVETPSESVYFTRPIDDKNSLEAAIYSYRLAARLMRDARIELVNHESRFAESDQVLASHIDDATDHARMIQADCDYLSAISASGTERDRLIESAKGGYEFARTHYALEILKYYIEIPIALKAFPMNPATPNQHYYPTNIEAAGEKDPEHYIAILKSVLEVEKKDFINPATGQYEPAMDQHRDEREEYITYIARCEKRLAAINTAATQPATNPR